MNDKNLIRRCKALAVHACANWRDHECLARDCPCDMAIFMMVRSAVTIS